MYSLTVLATKPIGWLMIFLFLVTVPFLGAVSVIVFLFFWFRQSMKYGAAVKKNLLQNGLVTSGKIVGMKLVSNGRGGNYTMLSYTFINQDTGEEVKGYTGAFPTDKVSHLSEGKKINIIYNPQNPKESLWEDEDEIQGR